MGVGSSSSSSSNLPNHRSWSNEPATQNYACIHAHANEEYLDAVRRTQVLENRECEYLESRNKLTDWPGDGSYSLLAASAMSAQVQESMEFTRTISQLAAANQQLAAAHNLTLGHLQWLFNEYRKPHSSNVDSRTSGNTKMRCPSCRTGESNARGTVKTRKNFGKQSTAATSTSRRLRVAKTLSSFEESRDEVDDKNIEKHQIESNLRREIEDLNTFKLESQMKNDRLMNDLEEQRLVIQRLTQDFEDSRRECEEKEARLQQVTQKLTRTELESARLLAELETFQSEKISIDKLAKAEAEKISYLRTRLAEQDEERRKHLLALDEAAQQIRALELAIQANHQSTSNTDEESKDSEASASSANEEFKKELLLKREARQRALAAISSEMDRLKRELEAEKVAHSETAKLLDHLKEAQAKSVADARTDDNDNLIKKTEKKISDRVEALRLSDLLKVSDEVTSDLWLQLERTDDLRFQLENDPEEHRLRINSLKRLSEETRKVLRFRKQQVNILKDKLAQILVRLGDRYFLDEIDEIREEADRQIVDIARSRSLCDERSRILAELKDHCFKEIHELKVKLDSSRKDNQSLEEDLRKTEDKMDVQDAEILNLESQLGLAKADCRDLQNQMSVINSLFTQMLLSASSAEMDLDRLTQLLQENHDLISDMAKENGTEAAALPKLLLDIIEQVDGRTRENEGKKEEDDLQEENIAHNLPKVWRVLLELLSCHAAGSSGGASPPSAESAPDSCYKSVDTPTGPRLVISVSKTYIRLKELILEKKSLEKEMNRMKQLNTHLESKLGEQEKRLSTVSDELSKTWNIVGRMQAQHQQLHTHEKILRYELQQKRKMLQELKKELEYCRETWESARQKNTNTEIEWRSLRREFAARKALAAQDSFNNSGESGFSDERDEETDEDEDGTDVGKRIRPINSRRRVKKDDSRAITPDTESEQPTDTEFSEPKTGSSSTSGQRTPTPETEAELENSEIIEEEVLPNSSESSNPQSPDGENLDPLDKALTNVIQDLIEKNESTYFENASSSDNENTKADSRLDEAANNKELQPECRKDERITEASIETTNESVQKDNENTDKTNTPIFLPVSVFSIGPFPNQTLPVKNVQFSNPLVVGPSNKASESLLEVTPSACSNTEEKNAFPEKNSFSQDLTSESSKSTPSTSIIEEGKKNMVKLSESSSSLKTVQESLTEDNEEAASSTPDVAVASKVETETEAVEKRPDVQTRLSDFPSNEVLDARAARLKSLEEQAEWLVKKVNDTNRRGTVLNTRLEELHETYGQTPAAPPMPDVLPAFRLRTEVNNGKTSTQTNDSVNESPGDSPT